MKAVLPSALIFVLSASAAQAAALQIETRAFHSNLHLEMKDSVETINGQDVETQGSNEAFQNAAGGGVAFAAQLDKYLSLGVGYDRARYFPDPDTTIDHQIIGMFTRWTLHQGESNRLYLLAGVSQHSLLGKNETLSRSEAEYKYSPVMNYDVGLGHTWTFGLWNVGLAYKYSDSFGRGDSRTVIRTRVHDEYRLVTAESKTRFRRFNIEQQELSLNFGVNL
jgi:hypothetical protein